MVSNFLLRRASIYTLVLSNVSNNVFVIPIFLDYIYSQNNILDEEVNLNLSNRPYNGLYFTVRKMLLIFKDFGDIS